MAMRGRDEVVLWPTYFDSKRTRSEGRKVPKSLAKSSPTVGMIEKALRQLGFSYRLVPDACYPGLPWKRTGSVLVKKTSPKGQILKDVAKRL